MVKTFRKIAALTAAIALVASFAVCASALTVNPTTVYSGDDILVTTVVSGEELTEGTQVTYYAENASAAATGGIVYIDQKPAVAGRAEFSFVTDAAYVGNAFKVSYTGAPAATPGEIPEGVRTYNVVVSGNGGSASAAIADNANPNGTYTVAYTPATGYYVSDLTVTGGVATLVRSTANSLTFTLTLADPSEVNADIAITATETAITAGEETGSVVQAGFIVAGADSNDKVVDEDGNKSDLDAAFQAAEGDRKVTIIGKVENLAADAEYGVIVSKDTIDTAAYYDEIPANLWYKALDKNEAGYFAVQLIDKADDATTGFIKSSDTYHTAVYFKAGNIYKIVTGVDISVQVAQ